MDKNMKECVYSEGVVDMCITECSEGEESELLCEVPTSNRYNGQQSGRGGEWRTVRNPKRKKVSSDGSADATGFDDLSNSDKLSRLYETVIHNKEILTQISSDQMYFHGTTKKLQKSIAKLYERTDNVERKINKHTLFMKTLAYRSIDTEARSRRNNVIIWGISERPKISVENLVLGFFEDELEIDTSNIVIDRAHRLGSIPANKRQSDPKRPIIVRFRDYNDVEIIMRRAYKLKGTPFGLDRDYPMEIVNARRELIKSQTAQEARADRKKVQVRYPAKLFIEGRLVVDKFPEWHKLLKEDRTAYFEEDICNEQEEDNRSQISARYQDDTDIDSDRSTSNSESESDSESVFDSDKECGDNESAVSSRNNNNNSNNSNNNNNSSSSSSKNNNNNNKNSNKGNTNHSSAHAKGMKQANKSGNSVEKQTQQSEPKSSNSTNNQHGSKRGSKKTRNKRKTNRSNSKGSTQTGGEASINRTVGNQENVNNVAQNNENSTRL